MVAGDDKTWGSPHSENEPEVGLHHTPTLTQSRV